MTTHLFTLSPPALSLQEECESRRKWESAELCPGQRTSGFSLPLLAALMGSILGQESPTDPAQINTQHPEGQLSGAAEAAAGQM